MFDALIERPAMLAIVIVSLAVINYGLGLWGERLVSRQHIIERASARITIEGSSRSRRSRIAWPFVTAVPIAVLAFYLDSVGRQILCGGICSWILGEGVRNHPRPAGYEIPKMESEASRCVAPVENGIFRQQQIAARIGDVR